MSAALTTQEGGEESQWLETGWGRGMLRNKLQHLEYIYYKTQKFPRFRGTEEVIGMEREQQSDNSWHTIVIVLLCCGVIKMLRLLGVIGVIQHHQSASYTPQENFASIKWSCITLNERLCIHRLLCVWTCLAEDKCRIYSVLSAVLMKPVCGFRCACIILKCFFCGADSPKHF